MDNNHSGSSYEADIEKQIAAMSAEKRELLELRLKQKRIESIGEKTIPRRKQQTAIPLSFAQQRLWLLEQFEPGSAVYNIPLALRLQGKLNFGGLRHAFNSIVRRHESLRTTFGRHNGQPVQQIARHLEVDIAETDFSSFPVEQREEEAQQFLLHEAARPFDFERGPLLRVHLVSLNPEDHMLLLVMHHIVSDGWSKGILFDELAAFYKGYLHDIPPELAELPIQYGDFSEWQRLWLQGEVLAGQLSYWKRHLDTPPLLDLPTDRPRPPVQTFHGERQPLTLSREITYSATLLSRQEGATPFMMMLAIFTLLLHRYSNQDDLLVGTPIANRNRVEIEGLIGFFVNTLVMRTGFSGNPSLKEFLRRVRDMALDAYTHQDLPFERLVEEMRPERNLSRTPLFQAFIALQNTPPARPTLEGLRATPIEINMGMAKFDLALQLTEREGGMSGWLEYNTDLFDSQTMKRMASHFLVLMESAIKDPNRPIAELPILQGAERRRMLIEWNDTARRWPDDIGLHRMFEAQAARTPDAIAVIYGEQHLTYAALNGKANQLAHYLRKLGVGPEVLVGICTERSLEMIIAILGILKAGGAYVPLEPSYPMERIAFMLEDCRARVLLTQEHLLHNLPVHADQTLCLDRDWPAVAGEASHNLSHAVLPDNLVYVIYTSGSTGRPKGCCNTHRAVCNVMHWSQEMFRISAADRMLLTSSFSFDISAWEIFWPLTAGGTLVLTKPGEHRDPGRLLDYIDSQQITEILLVPSLLSVLLEENGLHRFRSVKRVFSGGEALSCALQERFFSLLKAELHNLYGPTEAAIFATHWQCPRQDRSTSVPLGRPIANTSIYILDKNLEPVPIGVTGELHIGGLQVARGYLNRPELTAENFVTDPFSSLPGARMYKSGDLGRYRADSTIEFLGRLDDQVKIRGFRIELGEIESVLMDHPEIRECVVVARRDETGDKRLAAYIVAVGDNPPSIGEVRSFLETRLPDYMVPSRFMFLDALPLTLNGKVDRKALPDPKGGWALQENFVAPRNEIEIYLADIWAQLLQLQQVGIHDNFFELGGHSLLATRLVSRIRKIFGEEFPLRVVFEHPTVASQAEYIENAQKIESNRRSSGSDRNIREELTF